MKLAVLGLGNPGHKYSNTRHNVGHWFVDSLADSRNVKFKADNLFEVTSFSLETFNIILLKSLSYMNLNGLGLRSLLVKNSVSENNLILVQDEVNLPIGRVKLSHGKSAGGHNGVSSVINHLGFSPVRLRIGVRNENASDFKLSDFVLSKFSQEENKTLVDLFPKLVYAIRLLVSEGISISSNYINRNPIPYP